MPAALLPQGHSGAAGEHGVVQHDVISYRVGRQVEHHLCGYRVPGVDIGVDTGVGGTAVGLQADSGGIVTAELAVLCVVHILVAGLSSLASMAIAAR